MTWSLLCTLSMYTQTQTQTRVGGSQGLLGSQHQWENRAHTQVSSRQLENKEMQARAPPHPLLAPPTTGAALPLFTLEGISLDCKYFNSQKLEEGVGQGLGWCGSRLPLFIQAFSNPVGGERQHSKTCSCVLVPYTQHTLDTAGSTESWSVPCQLLQVLGLVTEQGEAGLFTESEQPLGRGGTSALPL